MKLKKFIEQTEELLPHEISILNEKKQFRDREREKIFEVLYFNTFSSHTKKDYDLSIDKRKYSHLMNWIQQRLTEDCTDEFYKMLNELDTKIKSDTVNTEEEYQLLKLIKAYTPHHFHFLRFYEVVKNYLTYLLIRVRLNDYELINDFIHNYHDDYIRCKDLNDRMIQASSDIVKEYHDTTVTGNSMRWLDWLRKNFQDTSLDGYNRHQSLVLLTYLALMNDSIIHEVLHYFDLTENEIKSGHFYSRKLLINFYGNKQLLLMKLNKHDLALYYGELSVKHKGPDYVMYLNNYCFNLMRLGHAKKALKLLKEALPYVKNMSNRYNRTLFISSLIRCYNENKLYDPAEQYADNQLTIYEKDILEHNWYRFFRSYMETLIHQGKYSKLKKVISKYNIRERETHFLNNFTGFPYFKWYSQLIAYKEGTITETKFLEKIEREKERLKATYDIVPSSRVMYLIDHSIKNIM